jgi:glycosyltransferase involved in cell wall biosynthesis
MSEHAKVSVVIPVYNGAHFLQDAVQSVLGQARRSLEIFVIDDGSTDETERVARQFGGKINYVRQENQGPPAARNHGLRLASGEFVGFLDVDDLWMPQKLATQLPMLLLHPELDAVWGTTQVMMSCDSAESRRVFAPSGEPKFFPQLASFLFRRRVFDRLGAFETAQRHADDIDFIARAQEAGMAVHQHQDVVLQWRRHDGNITNQVALDRKYFVAAIKRSLDRKRGRAVQQPQA